MNKVTCQLVAQKTHLNRIVCDIKKICSFEREIKICFEQQLCDKYMLKYRIYISLLYNVYETLTSL